MELLMAEADDLFANSSDRPIAPEGRSKNACLQFTVEILGGQFLLRQIGLLRMPSVWSSGCSILGPITGGGKDAVHRFALIYKGINLLFQLPGACQLCQVEPTCPGVGVGSEGAEGAVPLTFGERCGGRSVCACAGANLAAREERAAIV